MAERRRQFCTVLAFRTQTAAEGFLRWAQNQGYEGRLIPVPGGLQSGCGLAYALPARSPDCPQILEAFHGLEEAGRWGNYELYY